jgi:HK97 family phage portal protein
MFEIIKKSLIQKKQQKIEKIAISYLESLDMKGFANMPFFINSEGNVFSYINSAYQYFCYYSYVAPVGDAINKIANACSEVKIYPYGYSEKEAFKPMTDNDFVKKLQNPNQDQTYSDFFKEAYVDYLTCGNHYLYISTNSLGEVLELYNLQPTSISIEEDMYGHVQRYRYNKSNTGAHMIFEKQNVKIKNKNYELFKEEKRNAYLFHFKEPSRNPQFSNCYGDSLLQSVQLEAEQYLEASQYNTNLIINGFNAKILLSPKEELKLSQEQHQKIQEQLKQFYSGSNNSGNTALMPKIPMTAQFIGYNSKDMDFKELMQRTRVAVYNKFNISLPMVEGEYTSNANMKESDLQFYDKAVLPLLAKYCERALKVYKIFYLEDGVAKFDFEKSSIPALQERMIKNMSDMAKSRMISMNEGRKYVGFGRMEGGADALYVDGNSIAVAGDLDFTDTLGVPMRDIVRVDEDVEPLSSDEEEDVSGLDDEENLDDNFDDGFDNTKALSDIDLKPTESMASNAKRGLELRQKYNRGGKRENHLIELLKKQVDFNGNAIYSDEDITKILNNE